MIFLSDFGAQRPCKEPCDFLVGGAAFVNDGVHGIHNRHVDAVPPRQRLRDLHGGSTLDHAARCGKRLFNRFPFAERVAEGIGSGLAGGAGEQQGAEA